MDAQQVRQLKIHLVTGAFGQPICFEITGGEVHDSKIAKQLIDGAGFGKYFIADKGYDSEEIIDYAAKKGFIVIIPRRRNSKIINDTFDSHIYKQRHLVENLFQKLKRFRSIETRFEKLARNFTSILFLACSVLWLRIL